MKDLTFIEDGNKNFRPNGMVNFEKMSMLSRVFQEGEKLFPAKISNSLKNFLSNEYLYDFSRQKSFINQFN